MLPLCQGRCGRPGIDFLRVRLCVRCVLFSMAQLPTHFKDLGWGCCRFIRAQGSVVIFRSRSTAPTPPRATRDVNEYKPPVGRRDIANNVAFRWTIACCRCFVFYPHVLKHRFSRLCLPAAFRKNRLEINRVFVAA